MSQQIFNGFCYRPYDEKKDGSLEKYFAEKYPYENPKRLAWVADNVNGSQQR